MKLYNHQAKALINSCGMNRVAYYHDCGLGKTFTGSAKMIQLGEKMNLVICQKSKVSDWLNHFREYFSPEDVLTYDLTNAKQLEQFLNIDEHVPFKAIGIINYELAWRRPELYRIHDFTLMLDESSMIQNENAKQSDFILGMDPKNVILLSGTPTSGKYEHLWSQMHLLGWNISKELFLKQYVITDYLDVIDGLDVRSIPIVTGYKNVDRLKRKMAEHGCQFLKTEEVFDLPEQNFIPVKVPSSKEYKKFHKDRVIDIDGQTLVGDTTLTKMLYERELCGRFSNTKLQALTDLVNSSDDRWIIFYTFTADYEAILKLNALNWSRPLSVVNGLDKDLTAYEECDDSITLVQYQAGAKGLNLQKACRMIFFTPTNRCEDWMQSIKRIHRIGQNKPCFYYQMICEGSVEERMYQSLEAGVDYTEELFRKDELNEQSGKAI